MSNFDSMEVVDVEAGRPTLHLIAIICAVLGGILIGGGILLAYFGSSANTKFDLFGNSFSSTSVGVAMVFIGVVMVVLVLRRILKSLDHLAALKP